ncbi:GntR family transcriptional regulator [Rhodococcus sp. B50]|uniref:GntR family transcriptional regulator n=1 Tax=Rhodococcus sp. B50 TaxID=2682847 RepID=UPI0027DB0B4A|nr:GntR family transcriptional regulator [Rhodococcus sp. B50]MBS9373051.1 HTH-type transcriptional repressor YvoA [Rhodococcus sp. B50]
MQQDMRRDDSSVRGSTNQTRRAYGLIRSLIRSGFLVDDEQLVEDRLVKTMGIPRARVREALQQLAADGLVERRRRTGTRVRQEYFQVPVDDILPWHTPPGFAVRQTDNRVVPSGPSIRTRLGTHDTRVGLVEHVFEHVTSTGVEPLGVRMAYYREQYEQPKVWQRCPSLADAFALVYGVPLGKVDTVIDAVACDTDTARVLGLREGSPVLMREQLLRDVEGTVQEYTFSYYRADRVSFPLGTAPERVGQ